MNEIEVDEYVGNLWKKYKGKNVETDEIIIDLLEAVRDKIVSIREISMNFNIDEIHDLHMALGEVLTFFENDKDHKKIHKKEPCQHCKDYKKLYDRIVEKCNCIDNPKLLGIGNKDDTCTEK